MLVQESLTLVETCKLYTFIGVLIFLAIILFACLIRAIMGPRVADRVIAVNMMGTVVMVMISILALLLKEGYLMDICLIYACISFLAVVVITKVYLGVFAERMIEEEEKHGDV
ncbi:monovalent cation/H+ antiporter complex subunit F [Lacrimispora saccharolytica]|uniref:monovalent cation/H+ antiporter complex subunit F n=1 Tax=Lacrimispora saccharolytica TaxID=84030 RepID=UPI0015B95FED|nr:monovalent cation/H+ antiporter complex subunit F [Lacrimispora saccharolytica]MCI7557983.1 monovalent cation/H+ antiporter complex subunit F [Lachnospiraceae bacterium]MCF2656914.1 sodium:proton antiporter [Lacrimispora saccharolytica]MDD6009797.1 monovalent cation/H+ antiporter complex subunit F [Lachnospiraceae bacterium]MDD7548602.1 monovalent cation/H+ antiporter complex subunit F [Lachnospiraceae bacterium]MDY5000045.1 monovalent cation/H+ antiporter complex subunit F [Lachnospiraceae